MILRDLVFQALDNAKENGFTELLEGDVDDIAIDLLDYDVAIFEAFQDKPEGYPWVADLIPHIEAWREQNKGTK